MIEPEYRPCACGGSGFCCGRWQVITNRTCVECPACGFMFDESHETGSRDYCCPECGHGQEEAGEKGAR